MQHTRRTVLTAPVPTIDEVAKKLGVPRRRVKRLERLIDSFVAQDATRRRAVRTKRAKAMPQPRFVRCFARNSTPGTGAILMAS